MTAGKRGLKKAALIINTRSRKGEEFFFEILELLEKNGIVIESSYPVSNSVFLQRAVKEVIAKGSELVIVGGGDGTLSSVVQYFAYKNIVLGVLPLGTGNSFARSLELPLDISGMVKNIARGKVVKVNLGKVNDKYFANILSIGFNAKIAKNTPNFLKRYIGYFAYALVALKLFINKPSFNYRLRIDNKWIKSRANQVIVANGSYFGITKIYPEAHIDNNELIVCIIDAKSRRQVVTSWIGFTLGRPKLFAGVKLYSIQDTSIKTTPIQKVDIDGEDRLDTPIKVQLAKEALQVIVPQTFQDKK